MAHKQRQVQYLQLSQESIVRLNWGIEVLLPRGSLLRCGGTQTTGDAVGSYVQDSFSYTELLSSLTTGAVIIFIKLNIIL